MQHKISSLLIVVLAILVGYLYAVQCRDTIPRCAEDVVVVGVGQFDDGLWTQYVCGPALDDFGVYYR
jgi:hypothetical protein